MAPMCHEPLFDVAGSYGFEWQRCNDGQPTQQVAAQQEYRPIGRIDWFFSRGLDCADPATVPAVDAQGRIISDHDVLTVAVRLSILHG